MIVTPDVIMYPWEDVIGQIQEPIPMSKRGFYAVSALKKLVYF